MYTVLCHVRETDQTDHLQQDLQYNDVQPFLLNRNLPLQTTNSYLVSIIPTSCVVFMRNTASARPLDAVSTEPNSNAYSVHVLQHYELRVFLPNLDLHKLLLVLMVERLRISKVLILYCTVELLSS